MSVPRNVGLEERRPRSLADQNLAELGGRSSVLARQRADHIELDDLLCRLGEVPPTGQDEILLRLHRLVFPHAFAEEAVLWPVIRRVLPDGDELTLNVEREHQAINELAVRLEQIEPGSAERQDVLESMAGLLRKDVRDEEDDLLPRLQERLSPQQLRLLGTAWQVVRQVAPTRPHPIVSRRPPGNVAAAVPLAVLDRARDLVDAALQGGGDRAAPALRAARSGLTNAAHAVEHLPMLRRGEDPSTRVGRKPGVPWGMITLASFAIPLMLAKLAQSARHRREVAPGQ